MREGALDMRRRLLQGALIALLCEGQSLAQVGLGVLGVALIMFLFLWFMVGGIFILAVF